MNSDTPLTKTTGAAAVLAVVGLALTPAVSARKPSVGSDGPLPVELETEVEPDIDPRIRCWDTVRHGGIRCRASFSASAYGESEASAIHRPLPIIDGASSDLPGRLHVEYNAFGNLDIKRSPGHSDRKRLEDSCRSKTGSCDTGSKTAKLGPVGIAQKGCWTGRLKVEITARATSTYRSDTETETRTVTDQACDKG